MEAKLNKVDIEIRQGINEKTSNSKVHRKEENIIKDHNTHVPQHEIYLKMNSHKTMVVDAEMNVNEALSNKGKGLLLDRTL